MDIVVKGRNVEVPEHFREHVADKLARSERYDSKIIRVDVELSHETNRRQSKTCQRVQITLASRGPAVRAEACAENFYAALDAAATKLEARLRKSADRRHDRQHGRTPITAVAATPEEILNGAVPSVNAASTTTAVLEIDENDVWLTGADSNGAVSGTDHGHSADEDSWAAAQDGGPGRVVRIKDHPAEPITVDQALFQMELVGHDFYLFNDADTQLASVVYRRKGFDYGLLRLT
ncbi:MAG: ribosome-associated translation inhibitor RaiA [Nakamurella sp.]